MKSFIPLTVKRNIRSLILPMASLLLIFTSPVNAFDLQCKLVEINQLKPSIIAPMLEAANKGYLYRVSASTSNVTFKVNHFPFSTVEGQFSEFEGGLTLPEEIAQSRHALFIIKVASVATGDDELNDYLKSSAFFNAEKFPVIMFVSTGFEWINMSTARLIGNLTLHGMTRPLVFNVRLNTTETISSSKNQKVTMMASAEIQRSDFGMHELKILVSDTVKFNLKIEAFRVPG